MYQFQGYILICRSRFSIIIYLDQFSASRFQADSLFPGMTVHDFLGFPSLQEVECSGGSLEAEVDLLSLTLFRTADNTILAKLNTFKSTCKTFSEFSSCDLHVDNTIKSSVRTLVADLEEGETTTVGCNVTSFLENGHTPRYSWFITVHRKSKWGYISLSVDAYLRRSLLTSVCVRERYL